MRRSIRWRCSCRFCSRCSASFTLVPLAVGDASVAEVAEVIERLWGGAETLIVLSSDLSHYHSYQEAGASTARRSRASPRSPPIIDHEQACGATPVNGLLPWRATRACRSGCSLLQFRRYRRRPRTGGRLRAFAFYEPVEPRFAATSRGARCSASRAARSGASWARRRRRGSTIPPGWRSRARASSRSPWTAGCAAASAAWKRTGRSARTSRPTPCRGAFATRVSRRSRCRSWPRSRRGVAAFHAREGRVRRRDRPARAAAARHRRRDPRDRGRAAPSCRRSGKVCPTGAASCGAQAQGGPGRRHCRSCSAASGATGSLKWREADFAD